MNTAIFVINNTKIFLEPAIINMIPLLRDAHCPEIKIAAEVDEKYMDIISRILNKMRLRPMIDINSHKTVYAIIKLAKCLGISDEVISIGFIGWTSDSCWLDLWQPEYLYLIYLDNENLVDFDKYFRFSKDIFKVDVARAMQLPEIRQCPEKYINMLIFFKRYNFSQCFGENNPKVQKRISELNDERASAWKLFLVNPHEEFLASYFEYTPTNYKVWSCEGVSIATPPIPGRSTIVDAPLALARLRKFSYGLLDRPLNPNVKTSFPFENAIITGGSITKILDSNYNEKHARQSDIDIFIFASSFDERTRALEQVLEWFRTAGADIENARPITYYAISGSVVTIYIKDISRKVQVISIDSLSPFNILERFDLTHIQWCLLDGKTFYGTPEACKSMREKVTCINNVIRLQVLRLTKALYCGYSVLKTQNIIDEGIDITPLLDGTNNMLQQHIRQLHVWYYPRSEPDMDPEDERAHIISMIESDSKATIVTDDPKNVMNNVTIGGNFENGYESMLFSTFDINKIKRITHLHRNSLNVPIRDNRGVTIRFTTPLFPVRSIRGVEDGLEIVLFVDDFPFREFCQMLEDKVFRMYRNTNVTRHIMNDKYELTFIISQRRLDYQLANGVSCLRTQTGVALNIEEDVKEGDVLQTLFSIRILIKPDERAVILNPAKFVKYQKDEPEPAATVNIGFIEQELSVDTTITYDTPNI